MIARIKEWLSEFRPHLVTDGEKWAVRRRSLLGMVYLNSSGNWCWWAFEARNCFVSREEVTRRLARATLFQNLRKVDPKNPVRLVEGGEK